MTVRGCVVAVYCNQCGALFSAPAHHQRFCSTGCASRFWAGVDRRQSLRGRPATQDRILVELRRADGDWIDRSDLVTAVYGLDDRASRRAFKAALHRLRATWVDLGLLIGCRVDCLALDGESATYFRLERDISSRERSA